MLIMPSFLCGVNQQRSALTRRKKPCVSHRIEHAIFKGTKNHTYREIMDSIESVGGDINAYTSKEETCYQIAIANEYVERAFATLSELFFESTFPDDELQKEKTVVVDEIESYEDVPSEKSMMNSRRYCLPAIRCRKIF